MREVPVWRQNGIRRGTEGYGDSGRGEARLSDEVLAGKRWVQKAVTHLAKELQISGLRFTWMPRAGDSSKEIYRFVLTLPTGPVEGSVSREDLEDCPADAVIRSSLVNYLRQRIIASRPADARPAESQEESDDCHHDFGSGSSEHPKVFMSYSHDSPDHKSQVLSLSNRLRSEGVDCHLDQYELSPPEGWPRWMLTQIDWADFVLVICTQEYERRFLGRTDPERGFGAKWEGMVITQEVYDAGGQNSKFIPVILSPQARQYIPVVLRGATGYDVSSEEGYLQLYRHLTCQPPTLKPKLGTVRSLPPVASGNDAVCQSLYANGDEKQPDQNQLVAEAAPIIKGIVAESIRDVSPGVLPRVSKPSLKEKAVLLGINGDTVIRAIHQLIAEGVLTPFGLAERDELLVNLKHFGPIPDQVTGEVLMAIYRIGDHGSYSVNLSQLLETGFSKMQVFNATQEAERRYLLESVATFGTLYQWILTIKGCQYVEALLDEPAPKWCDSPQTR